MISGWFHVEKTIFAFVKIAVYNSRPSLYPVLIETLKEFEMQIKFSDLTMTPILESLKMLGFGIEIVYDSRDVVIAATVWTEANFEQSGEIGGFMCGQVVRELSSFAPRFELIIDSARVEAQRMIGLATNIVSLSCR